MGWSVSLPLRSRADPLQSLIHCSIYESLAREWLKGVGRTLAFVALSWSVLDVFFFSSLWRQQAQAAHRKSLLRSRTW